MLRKSKKSGGMNSSMFISLSKPRETVHFKFRQQWQINSFWSICPNSFPCFSEWSKQIVQWFNSSSFQIKSTVTDKSKSIVFSRVLRDSTPRSVRPSVCRLVGPLFTFLAFLSFLSSLLLPKYLSDLFYHCPCSPARDWDSHVSGLVYVEPFSNNMYTL